MEIMANKINRFHSIFEPHYPVVVFISILHFYDNITGTRRSLSFFSAYRKHEEIRNNCDKTAC